MTLQNLKFLQDILAKIRRTFKQSLHLQDMGATNLVYLLTGGNMGDRPVMLKTAKQKLEQSVGLLIGESGFYETEAWGNTDQPDFLNQALAFHTKLSPLALLEIVLGTEKEMGRTREGKWLARTIDIDILFYNDLVLESERLTLPHPHLHQRNFVLIPMMEIAAEFIHPIFQKSMEALYWESKDLLEVILFENT